MFGNETAQRLDTLMQTVKVALKGTNPTAKSWSMILSE